MMSAEGDNVSDLELVWNYVNSCASGALRLHECGPVWQMGAIAVLLCAAIVALIVVRARALRAKEW